MHSCRLSAPPRPCWGDASAADEANRDIQFTKLAIPVFRQDLSLVLACGFVLTVNSSLLVP